MTIRLQLYITLGITFIGYSVVFSQNQKAFEEYKLERSQSQSQNGRKERYRYRNVRDDGEDVSTGEAKIQDQPQIEEEAEEENPNPLFPPRSDSFWEKHEKNDGSEARNFEELSFPPNSGDQNFFKKMDTEKSRPNIILILTDDQDIELGSMEYMPETLKAFRENGVEFRHGYVTTPMCCPSRSSMLTGLYVHNHQVYTNNDNCSSVQWREMYEKKTFAAYLHESGYYTSYIGKYLNKYDGSHIPAGWDEWNTLLMNSRFYNYTVNRNGQNIRYGSNYKRDYYPDSIANDTANFLRRMGSPLTDEADERDDDLFKADEDEETEGSGASPLPSKKRSRKLKQPFLLVVSFPSPHGPEDSAPQYSHLFLNETPHHNPAYDFAPNSDKQWILQVTPKMNSNLKNYTNLLMAKRLQTLQSVDSAVKNIFDSLKSSNLEDETYIFYTSDHGYHVGQFGLIKGKSMPYEFDIRVPFFLKAPANFIAGGRMILEPVLNIDLAPTFLDLGGVPVPVDMDGRSMLPLLQKYSKLPPPSSANLKWTHTFLIESSGRREGDEHHGHNFPKYHESPVLAESRIQLVSEEGRSQVNELCDLHPHPCAHGQKKYCRKEKDRVRFRKCRYGLDFDLQPPISKSNQCSCSLSSKSLTKRSASISDLANFDWDSERRRIDDEIETLKIRIDELREKKRAMRQQLAVSVSNPSVIDKVQENESSQIRSKKKNNIHNSSITSTSAPTTARAEFMETTKSITTVTTTQDEDEEEIDLESPDLEDKLSSTTITYSSRTDEEKTMISKYKKNYNATLIAKTNLQRNSKKYISWENDEIGIDEDCNCAKLLNDPRWLRQREREERKKRKLISKIRKKQRFLNRIEDPNERMQAETCGAEDNMNCFWHDKAHWRTAPLWEGESFCFCMNSNNNTFSCLRSINSTHNYLYCHFITGFKMFFDLGRDPFQLRNAIGNLPIGEEEWMIDTLLKLKQCQGQTECAHHNQSLSLTPPSKPPMIKTTSSIVGNDEALEPSIWEKIFGTFRRKKHRNGRQKKINQN